MSRCVSGGGPSCARRRPRPRGAVRRRSVANRRPQGRRTGGPAARCGRSALPGQVGSVRVYRLWTRAESSPHWGQGLWEPIASPRTIRWGTTVLGPVATVHLFLLQVLHGNTAWPHSPTSAGRAFTASAYCQARARLPLAVFRASCGDSPPRSGRHRRDGALAGHRTFLVDGSSFSMPDTPELAAALRPARRPAPRLRLPRRPLLALFHAGTGLLLSSRGAAADPRHGPGRRRPPASWSRATSWSATAASAPSPTWPCWPPRPARRVPHPSEADRRLHPAAAPRPPRLRIRAKPSGWAPRGGSAPSGPRTRS